MMNDEQRKAMLKETFDTVSGGYDNEALRFFPDSAENMARLIKLRGDEQVLDVACGTGHATVAFARIVPRGKVTAVDFSSGMLAEARKKAAGRTLRNVELFERDMQALGFPGNSFDLAVCAFGIFFVEDMDKQLAHMASMVKPGGRIMISNFQENYFHPLKDMMTDRLSGMGVQIPPQTWKRIGNEKGCAELFEKAGLEDIHVVEKNVGYYLDAAEQWWDIIWNAGYRRLISRLDPVDLTRFRKEHLQEVDALRTDKGIFLDIGVLYTTGTKPARRA